MQYETNSKKVQPGDIFVAIKGIHNNGNDYIHESIKNGASKIITDEKIKIDYPHKIVKNTNKYLLSILSKENKILSKSFKIIGITGTKGKSTTAMISYDFLKMLNINVGYIGTLGIYYKDKILNNDNTTPDITSLNKILKLFKNEGITHIVMEISSHALIEKRIKGLSLSYAAFTNFSEDHLDFHHTMKDYLKAKLKIFKYLHGPMVLNTDDKVFPILKRKVKRFLSIGNNGIFKIIKYILHETNTIVYFEYKYNEYVVSIPFVGKFNIYNYLESIGLLTLMGFDILDIINYTNNLKPIKGRCELIKKDKKYIVIDYAHSPSAVSEVLDTYNSLKKGRIITIIGCGGNRDKIKRPIMADISCKKSDYVIFTSDNPRDEKPKDILKDMTENLKMKNYEIIENRKKAIKKGVKLLKCNDFLLILGKGHETYQIINNVKYDFDDKKEACKLL